ncbi:hypothetical protein PAXRUDRAFT_821496 [Paxillus rubicundulus Ve08.2h10]|uniref:Uncharacterized protein n=1 Tax=Paxillus rubicundulus Ve08.2h10 TaxID=930991 RepID=A0A0D0E6H2_9AGAM|nr:hypothetical protein PAXRUDRAFT_821496 [Paxillus rubicundulus Ve08.2h10]
MLSAHYTGTPPLHPHTQHTPHHTHPLPILPSHLSQQSQYAHQQHAISSLLPTPPSSPPTIGLHPVESTLSLLESLVAFYHQERMWVYRTRAQLEMDLIQRVSESQSDSSTTVETEEVDGSPTSPPGRIQSRSPSVSDAGTTADNSPPSPPTKWLKRKKAFNLRLEGISSTRGMLPPVARGRIAKHPYPHTRHRARQSSNLNPASAAAPSHQGALPGTGPAPTLGPHLSVPRSTTNATMSFYPPTATNATTTLTSPYLSHPSFQFPTTTNQPLIPGTSALGYAPASNHQTPATFHQTQSLPTYTSPLVLGAGGREPSVQILEMFERMMQSRMESCERVTRMVRGANNIGSVGNTGAGAGAGAGIVGGAVGGFSGPVGMNIGSQGVGAYPQVRAQAQEMTPTQQGFPMGVNMG